MQVHFLMLYVLINVNHPLSQDDLEKLLDSNEAKGFPYVIDIIVNLWNVEVPKSTWIHSLENNNVI